MEPQELVMTPPRARRVPETMYVSGICLKGTETTAHPQFYVYSPNPTYLKMLVDSYNELLRIKKEYKEKTPKKK